MKEINHKTIGTVLTVFALVLIVILGFVKANFDNQAVFLCEAVSTNPDLAMSECPAHTSNIPWLLLISFGISSVILAGGLYLLFVSRGKIEKKSREHTEEKVDPPNLSEEEQQVYNLIKEKNGSMYQSEIVKETGLNKVRVTRILDKLEHDDKILERKRRGMTNIVVLK